MGRADTPAVVVFSESPQASSYCGLLTSLGGGVELAAGAELAGGAGSAVAGDVCDAGNAPKDFGRSGTVVIALSGFSR